MRRMGACLTVLAIVVLVGTASAVAENKISGTDQCAKPDPQYVIQVGDRPNHAFSISQSKCTWSKPMEIAGVQSKEGLSTAFTEANEGKHRTPAGYYTETMANGDKAYFRYRGIGDDGTWTLVRGTGKLKGIKGKGTYKGKVNPNGSITYEIEGEYQSTK